MNDYYSNRRPIPDDVKQTLFQVATQRVAADRDEAMRRYEADLAGRELGRYGAGNIDLYNRPQYMNPDGSVSTVKSMSFGTDEGEILVPTVGRDPSGNPYLMSDDEAIKRYYDTGEYPGKFRTVDAADDYADRLHMQQDAFYRRR